MQTLAKNPPITVLLNRWQEGDREALEELMPLVYQHLSLMARKFMRGERSSHTFSAADLVNEVYLRLFDNYEKQWESRVHFYAVAGKAMRYILINHAAKKKTQRRGGDEFERAIVAMHELGDRPQKVLSALDEAMERLKHRDLPTATMVELRFFCGFTIEEVADTMNSSPATVKRKLQFAKHWLDRYLQ